MEKVETIIIITLIIMLNIVSIVSRSMDLKKSDLAKQEVVQYVQKHENKLQVDFDNLLKTNDDTVGYIEVNNTEVKYSVVQSEDNEFYLKHDFNKEDNISGWVFADYRNKFDGTDKNIILYGHNMKDGSIFGSLTKIMTEEWYKNEENLYIPFSTVKENMMFKVFSIYQIEPEDYYIETEFSGNEFFSFANIIRARSIYDFKEKVGKTDMILTLSTCTDSGDERIVLHAVRIS